MVKKPERKVRVPVDEQVTWKGKFRVTRLRSGFAGLVVLDGQDEAGWSPNIITDDGKDLMAEALRDASAQPEITWVALGNDATTPVAGDSLLGGEVFRKQMTSQAAGGTGVSLSLVYIAPGEANEQLEEIGWFAGPATGSADSGILIARVLFSRLKDNLESLQIERTDTIS
jgi:hypothetical protein